MLCSGVLLQGPGEMRGKRQARPDKGSGRCAMHSPPEPRVRLSQLKADYGACQGLKSSLSEVWPRREWAELPVRSPAL